MVCFINLNCEVAHTLSRSLISDCAVETTKRLIVSACDISFIIVNRFLMDLFQLVEAVHMAHTPTTPQQSKIEVDGSDMHLMHEKTKLLVHLSRVSVIVPESGWSSNMFAVNAGLIQLIPYADGEVLKNQVQESLKESAPTIVMIFFI